jgi:hypothetical protein
MVPSSSSSSFSSSSRRLLIQLLFALALFLVLSNQVKQHAAVVSQFDQDADYSSSWKSDWRVVPISVSSIEKDAKDTKQRNRNTRSIGNNVTVSSSLLPKQKQPSTTTTIVDLNNLPDYVTARNLLDLPPHIAPLNTMIDFQTNEIIGNVSHLLDIAIIGFGKCGTSTMMYLLANHPELQVLTVELWALVGQEPYRLVARLHRSLQHPTKRRGYKCPGDILQPHALQYYHTLWPSARLLIGVRHPILHFQSLYNFRIQNFEDSYMKHPNQLIGGCYAGHKMTCTLKSDWAYYLFGLGKQFSQGPRPLTELEEQIIYQHPYRPKRSIIKDPSNSVTPIRNNVFLFELHQLGDKKNATRQAQFQSDLQHFLQLKQPFETSATVDQHFIPGRVWPKEVQDAKNRLKINICQDEFIPLRRELLRQARLSAAWIQTVFLQSPGVYCSNREHLYELLDAWKVDPCGPASMQVTQEESDAILQQTKHGKENDTKLKILAFLKQYSTTVDEEEDESVE